MSLKLINTAKPAHNKSGLIMTRHQAADDRYCPICNKTFVLKIHLVVHLRNHHNNPVHGNGALVLLPQNTDASNNGAAKTSLSSSLPLIRPALMDNKTTDTDVNHPATEESGVRNGERTTEQSPDLSEKFRLSSGDSGQSPSHSLNCTPVSTTQKSNTGNSECSNTCINVESMSSNQDPGQTEINNESTRSDSVPTVNVPSSQMRDERLIVKTETRNRRMLEVPQRQRINKVWGFSYSRTSTPGPDRWTCVVCNKGLNTISCLALHLRKNHGSNMAIIDGGGQPRGPLVHSPMLVRQEGRSRLKPWICRKCGKNFMRHQLLWKHRINFCGLGSKYKCPCCPAEFKQKFMLFEHRMTHNSRGKLKLKVSKSSINWRGKGIGPIRLSLDSVSHSSEVADKTVTSSSTNGHSKENKSWRNKSGSFQCHISGCNMVLHTSTELSDHVRLKHHIYPCGECGSVLPSRLEFDLHYMKQHNTVSSNQHKKIPLTPVVKVEHPRLERSDANEKVTIPTTALTDPRKPAFRIKQNHLETTPSPASSKAIIKVLFCAKCNKRFPNVREYLAHQRLHTDVKSTITKLQSGNTGTAGASNNARPSTATGSPIQNISSGRGSTTVIGPNGKSVVIKTEKEEDPPLHECSECNQKFRTDRSYRRHRDQSLCKKIEHPYACEKCDKSFTREATLKNHMNSQHEQPATDDEEDDGSSKSSADTPEMIQCPVCGKILKTKCYLRDHITRMHGERRSVNEKSAETFTPSAAVRQQSHGIPKVGRYSSSPSSPTRMETSAEHLCNECRKTFDSRRDLAEHLLWHNALKNSKQVFRGVRDPVTPLALEYTPLPLDHKCAICGGGFHRREDMLTHVRYAHSRKGAYGCTDCKRVFQDAISLIEHQGIHKDASPGRKRTKWMEEPTMRRIDKNTSFPCIYCGSKFPTLNRLHEHRNIMHPTEKSLICPYPNCCIPYVHEMGLKRHMRDHNL